MPSATLTAGRCCWPGRTGPTKRGGRTNLNAQRTLDHIVVGRISQMTDPALDSERHTFDILALFGRVLLPGELPLRAEGANSGLRGKHPAALDLSGHFQRYVHRRAVHAGVGGHRAGYGLPSTSNAAFPCA